MLRARIPQSFETGLAAYLVAQALAGAQLRLGGSAIIDAVNGVEPAKEMWRTLATRHGVSFRVIECTCSDPDLQRRRLADRRRGLAAAFVEPTWDDVEVRRREWTAWAEWVLAVDSVAPIETNVERVLTWIAT